MRFKRVFFVIPNLQWENGYPSYPHPGLGYIIETLEQHGIKCGVLDMTLGYNFSNLIKKIREFNPDLIGLTLYSYRHRRAYELIKHIRQITNKPVVIGGPHVSLMGKKCMEDSDADLAIKYEGEYPLLEVCLGDPLEEINNLIYRDGKDIKENPNRPFITNLNILPFPKYSPFELKKYAERSIGILSSRGCPFMCTYCSVKTTMGRNFRARNPENIVSELKYWYGKGYRHFHINDDTFNADIKRVNEICDLIEKEKLTNARFSAWQGMRLDKVDRAFLEKLKKVGFYSLAFGVESYNNQILQNIKKGETTRQIDEGVRIACELGFYVILFFILGLPGETWQDVENSFNFSLKYPIGSACFFNPIPYPGTELFDELKKDNLILYDPAIYLNETVNTNNRKILYLTHSMNLVQREKAIELGERYNRKVSQRYMRRKLSRIGLLGNVLAWLICSKFVKQSWIYLDHYGVTYKGRLLIMRFIRFKEIE
jgi:anaerobic magnesium-protoporphyrin IX monomethyl ester cyclase